MPSDPKALSVARMHFGSALDHLREAAGILRGPQVAASPEAMATEMAVTRAIQALEGAGFLSPRPEPHVRFSGSLDEDD